jgi:uncharacterized membrane protein
MPWEWETPLGASPTSDAPGAAEGAPPIARLHAWPFRSLPKRGFVAILAMGFLLLLVPVFAFLGTIYLWWVFLPGFAALGALWWFIDRSYRDGEILEELEIWPDRVRLTRDGPHGAHAEWQADLYWVTLQLHPTGGPVPDYVTLRGGGREVEIGSFLSDAERPMLYETLSDALVRAKSRRAPE